MKDKILPLEYDQGSLEELTEKANKIIKSLEDENNLTNSVDAYQELLRLDNIIEKKFKKNLKSISEETNKKIKNIIKNEKKVTGSVNYLNTMPSKRVINQNRKGNLAADNLRLKRIDTIERTLNDIVVKFNNHFVVLEKNIEKNDNNTSEDYSDNEVISNEEFYTRSRRIFFGFIFSISIIFLLIIVSTGINIFI